MAAILGGSKKVSIYVLAASTCGVAWFPNTLRKKLAEKSLLLRMDNKNRDIQWLGEDYAELGPAARAGLGILVENDDWSWWTDPGEARDALERAISKSGVVKWGGDASVMEADQWVDPLVAISLARAFEDLSYRLDLHIKVVRSVWSWPGHEETVNSAALELSKVVSPERVFVDWPRDSRPRFPLIAQRRVIAGNQVALERIRGDDTLSRLVDLRPDARIADIVVADSLAATLSDIAGARLVILHGTQQGNLLAEIGTLRGRLSAQCVIHVEADNKQIAEWIQLYLTAWGDYGMPLADAVAQTNRETNVSARILVSTQTFFLGSAGFLHQNLNKEPGRQRLGSGDVQRAVKSPETIREVLMLDDGELFGIDIARPGPPMERVLDARVRQSGRDLETWPLLGEVDIVVDIKRRTPLHNPRPGFPEQLVEWEGDGKHLKVHLFEIGSGPATRSMYIRRTGDSEAVVFNRTVGSGPVDMRLLVSDEARILQTARLQSAPGEAITFFVENVVTPVHRQKQTFDLAVLVNDSLGSQPSVTLIPADGDPIFSPLTDTEAERAREKLLAILQQAVVDPEASLAPLLLDLANQGSLLWNHLRDQVPNWPTHLTRVQLVTQSNAFFPIEYLYEGTVPESSEAELCSERIKCLENGCAIPGCAIREAAVQLCPMGFVGVTAIVERHTWIPTHRAPMWTPAGLAERTREAINDLSKIVFGADDRADDFDDKEVAPHEAVRLHHVASSLGVERIPNWTDWKRQVAAHSPSLLLLVVHMEKSQLFLENGAGLNLAGIGPQHVGKGAPVAIAIGCGTGHGDLPGGTLPAVLLRRGARVVIAAMTDVLGRHANRAARDLATRFRAAAISKPPILIGEIMRELRREFLADDIALGLALVAFGDADTQLGTCN